MKLCIIGAGAAGLCAARHGSDFACEVVVFEKTLHVGGIWVYSEDVGKDKYGVEVHSCSYKGMETNLPIEVMGYPDVNFPKNGKSYVSAEEVRDYYENYAKKFELYKMIKFEHNIVRVRPLDKKSWEVIVHNLPVDEFETYHFDAILVCNGHYSAPKIPKFKGHNQFKGQQLHSHDYRFPEKFAGEKVLIIGAGPSAIDCSRAISKIANVTCSHHSTVKPYFGENVVEKPDIQEITSDGVIFTDGSYQDFTVIIYCTGYKFSFPFLSIDCGLKCEDYCVRPLYKHCININRPSMAFIGIPFFIYPNQTFDLQARFFLTFITGRKTMPSKDEMFNDTMADIEKRKAKSFTKDQSHVLGIDFQDEYHAELSETAGTQSILPVITKLYLKSRENFFNDSVNFRKFIFQIIDDENFTVSKDM